MVCWNLTNFPLRDGTEARKGRHFAILKDAVGYLPELSAAAVVSVLVVMSKFDSFARYSKHDSDC